MSSLGILSAHPRMARPLGSSGLGTTMSPNVSKYMPELVAQWNQYPADTQAQINAQANLVAAQHATSYQTYVAEGACDGTRAGRLAGGLKEYLISAGGDPAKMSPDPAVFGAQECAEWWRIFAMGVDMGAAQHVSNNLLDTICKGVTVKIPSCPKPAPVVAPVSVKPVSTGPIGPVVATKPKMSTANMMMIGGGVAAVSVVGYAIAKKKGWIKAKAG